MDGEIADAETEAGARRLIDAVVHGCGSSRKTGI
jgi:hypothetical protein